MQANRLTGSRIREKRLDRGMRQAALAEAVGISPSYLNLIEHNRRRIGGKLLRDLARVLEVDPTLLNEGADVALMDKMRSAASQFNLAEEIDRTEEMAARYPSWSALIAAQSQRISALEERIQLLSDRMSFDPKLAASLHEMISAVTSIRSTASILVGQEQLDVDWQRRFNTNIYADSCRLAESSEALVGYLEAPAPDISGPRTPMDEVEAFLSDRDHVVEPLEGTDHDVAGLVEGADVSTSAAKLLSTVLEHYQNDAAALPRVPFVQACRDLAYDPVALAGHFGVPMTVVLRRLATLTTDDGHPQMGLAVCDASGTVTLAKVVPGFTIPRFGGACPLWPLFTAFARPSQPIRQRVTLPGASQSSLLCYAVAETVGLPQFDSPPAFQSTMLVVLDHSEDATPLLPIGVSCRICPRNGCTSRREPAMTGMDL